MRELCITGAGSDPETPYGCGRGAVLTADALMEPTLSGDLPGTPDTEFVDNGLKEAAFQDKKLLFFCSNKRGTG